MSIKSTILGTWVNEYESTMVIETINEDTFTFVGSYSSSTGETGSYRVEGCYNPDSMNDSIVVSISIGWNKVPATTETKTVWDCSVSSMTGQIQQIGEGTLLTVTHILVKPTAVADNWGSSIVDKLTFVKQ